MFAVVHLPAFSLQAALRHEPDLWAKAVALVDGAIAPPRVFDATPSAKGAAVHRGLTPTQALARCDHLIFRSRSPSHETVLSEMLLQCAYSFSPNLEMTVRDAVTLDLRGLATVSIENPSSLRRWMDSFYETLANLNLRASIGVASTPSVAYLAAQSAHGVASEPREFIASLSVAALQPSPHVASILKSWGIRTVGELLALGQEAVSERLGLEALALFAAASTTALRPLHLVLPSEQFVESFDFEHEVETLQPLLFILRRFADCLSQRLELGHLMAERFTLGLRLESNEALEHELRLPQPACDTDVFFRALSTYLETVRTRSPIKGVVLKAHPVLAHQKQLSLFETVLRDPRQFQETLGRLSALLGSDRVGTPVLLDSHRPDAFRLIPPDFENAANKTKPPPRSWQPVPLRRFRPAVKAHVETEGNRPASLRCSIAQGKLKVTVGPWRASGNWWESGGWHTEEWDVETSSGKVLRLSRQPGGWFVEAILD